MNVSVPKILRTLAALAAAALPLILQPAISAQQVTYYDFDTPATQTQYSYRCSASSTANPLLCLNGKGGSNNPSFISDSYPASVDPTGGSGSTQTAAQMTPAAESQGGSLWFSVPQKVANGFSVWFAFRIRTSEASSYPGDGMAFVIQNSQGAAKAPNGGYDPVGNCQETGAGPTALGDNGGCLGFGGMDNSLALELDTYDDSYDPPDYAPHENGLDDHISLQDCGAGQVNSPNDYSPDGGATCSVNLGGPNGPVPTLVSLPQSSTPGGGTVTLDDGNVHQVVMIYSGPNEATPNLLQVYIDPPYVPGTHTPAANAVPVFSGTFDMTKALNLIDSGTANDSAYVGFTAATGLYFEQNELLGWTFTPHTTVTQQQPLNPPGTATVFPFGTHDYTVNYPTNGPSTSGISMIVTANTMAPALFSTLIGGSQFAGSQCQVYDDTGGNCIVYSVSCVETTTMQPVACPSTVGYTDGNGNPEFVTVTSSYNNSVQPVSPGFLQGDPFYSQISSISVSGTTATVTCSGECSVTPGQTVTIFGSTPTSFDGTVQVATVPATNQFTFATTSLSGSTTIGGYLTSGNVKNVFYSISPNTLDLTSTGHPNSFSDFIVTSVTTVGSQTQISAASPSPEQGSADVLTATVTAASAAVPGPGSIPAGTAVPLSPSAVTFYTGSGGSLTPIAGCTGVLVTATSATTGTAGCSYTPASTAGVTITAVYSDPYHVSSSGALTLAPVPAYDAAVTARYANTQLVFPGATNVTVCIAPKTKVAATGTVSLYDGSSLLTTQPVQGGGCMYWYISPALAAGSHPVTAVYSGDKNNPAGSSAVTTLTVSPVPVNLSASCWNSWFTYGGNYQCAVTASSNANAPLGAIGYQLDNQAPVSVGLSWGNAQLTIVKPAVGPHILSIWYPQQTNYAAAGPRVSSFTVAPAP